MGEPRWVRRFTEAGRTGAYLSVVDARRRATAARRSRSSGPTTTSTSSLLFRAFCGDLDAARRVVDADVVHADVRAGLVETLGRRGG